MATVRVKIAVAVAPDGAWQASGYGIAPGRHDRGPMTKEEFSDELDTANDIWNQAADNHWPATSTNIYWVEADLMIPEPKAPPTVYASDVELVGGPATEEG